MILPEYIGKGIMTKAIKAAVKYGFETLKLHSSEAVIDPENLALANVLKKMDLSKKHI